MKDNKQKIVIYTDGGARNNPGPAGVGVSIVDENGKVLKETSEYLGEQTNNFAEYQAVILGLETFRNLVGTKALKDYDIEMKLDSELVARQLSNEYQVREPTLFPQFMKVHNMQVKDFPKITFTHIPREENKRADELANEAMDRGN